MRNRSAFLLASVFLSPGVIMVAEQPAPQDSTSQPASSPTPDQWDQPNVPASTAGYVHDRLCADCHADIWDTYQHVGMARSFYRTSANNVIENFTANHFYHAASDKHYELVQRDGSFFVKRYRLDETGQPIHLLEQEIHYVIGSGNHSRGYLYRTEIGELFEIPVVWYTQTQSWGMAPGYDRADHEDFSRPITRECLACHNAYPTAGSEPPTQVEGPKSEPPTQVGGPKSDLFGQPQRFPANLPEGIGCQRCHGPGAEHLQVCRSPASTVAAQRASIVNPGRLDPKLRDDVCFQCHLQPTSQLTSFLRRWGRGDYEYRPGLPLEDYIVHFDFGPPDQRSDRFEINHHPYRLLQSRCHRESDGRLSCLTCHDPHRKVPAVEAEAHYRRACLTCHQVEDCTRPPENAERGTLDAESASRGTRNAERDSASESVPPSPGTDPPHVVSTPDCVACHMPKRRTQDVVQVVMTDHRIQIPMLGEDLLAPRSETPPPRGMTVHFFDPSRAPADGAGDLYLAMSAAIDGNVSALADLEAALQRTNPAADEPRLQLGISAVQAGLFPQAVGILAPLATRGVDPPLVQANLGVALSGVGQPEAALETLQAAAQLAPDRADIHYNLGAVLARLRRTEEAVRHYREALRLRPHYAKCRFNLANLLAREGRLTEAAAEYRQVLVYDPDTSDAAHNLGVAARMMDRWDEAITSWEYALRLDPQRPDTIEELVIARLSAPAATLRDEVRAVALGQQLAGQRPNDARATLLLASALWANDRCTEAAEAAQRLASTPDAAYADLVRAAAAHWLNPTDASLAALRAVHQRLHPQEGGTGGDRIRRLLLAILDQPAPATAPSDRPAP